MARRSKKVRPITDMFNDQISDLSPITQQIADAIVAAHSKDLWPSSKLVGKGLKKKVKVTRVMKKHKVAYPNPQLLRLTAEDIQIAVDLLTEHVSE